MYFKFLNLKTWKITTWNWLDLETLGSWLILPKNHHGDCLQGPEIGFSANTRDLCPKLLLIWSKNTSLDCKLTSHINTISHQVLHLYKRTTQTQLTHKFVLVGDTPSCTNLTTTHASKPTSMTRLKRTPIYDNQKIKP